MKKTKIDRHWLPKVRFVGINIGDHEIDIYDDETGVVVYTTLASRMGLTRAVSFR